MYSVYSSEIKAALAGRAIRTLKARIYRFITSQNSSRYIDELQNMVRAYNHSPHSGLKNKKTPVAIHSLKDPSAIKRQFHVMYKNPKQPASRGRKEAGREGEEEGGVREREEEGEGGSQRGMTDMATLYIGDSPQMTPP